jgi:hypothetical protein
VRREVRHRHSNPRRGEVTFSDAVSFIKLQVAKAAEPGLTQQSPRLRVAYGEAKRRRVGRPGIINQLQRFSLDHQFRLVVSLIALSAALLFFLLGSPGGIDTTKNASNVGCRLAHPTHRPANNKCPRHRRRKAVNDARVIAGTGNRTEWLAAVKSRLPGGRW